MKKNTLFIILLFLNIGLNTLNFIMFKMKNNIVNITTTLIYTVVGVLIVLIMKDNFLRKKES
jgi:hypothetical protein